MTVVTLILVYIGIIFLAGILTWIVEDVLGDANGDDVPIVSHWVGWSVVFILIFHMANRPQYDYYIELDKHGVTITDKHGDYKQIDLNELEITIIEDNI